MKVTGPLSTFLQGWGTDFSNAIPIEGYWQLTIMDQDNHPITVEFDFVDGQSPLIIGLDSAQYADTFNRTRPRTFSINLPQENLFYNHNTHTSKE